MKTAGWSTCCVAGQVDRSKCAVRNCWEQWTQEGTQENQVWSDQEDHEERGSKDCAASTCEPHSVSFKYRSRSIPFNTGTPAIVSTVVPSQINVECHRLAKNFFSDEYRFVLGTDDNRVRVWRHLGAIFQQVNARPHTARVAQDFLRHFQTLPWPDHSPDLSPAEHDWDQLKRQMSSCHSVHDLELAVQDLWAHPLQNNIRCLINSMPDSVTVCIAAGGGPTCY
ncbi:transposable element Tcb2 transposase [Trichonephila clavipes]|nr:transposable element Tcb2 transposase [Trichonephila clavipes]